MSFVPKTFNEGSNVPPFDAAEATLLEAEVARIGGGGGGDSGGGGTGGTQYIVNPTFESGIIGWNLYNDGAVAVPVDGTGGAATITLASNATAPIFGTKDAILSKPASNCKGQGLSTDLTVDRGDLGQPLYIALSSKASAAYADGDIGIFIYDITNANIIYPSIVSVPQAGGSISAFYACFIPSTSQSYRLCLHITSTNASAWTFEMDNVYVGNQKTLNGAAIGNWTSFTPGVNPSNLPGAWTTAKYKRMGGDIYLELVYTASGAGTGGILVGLNPIIAPLGLTIISTGTGQLAVALKSGAYRVDGVYDTANLFTVTGGSWSATVPFTWAAGDAIELKLSYPCAQWQSNVNMASDATEYAFNTSTTAANDTTSFGYGQGGNLIPNIAATGTNYSKRVRFLRPKQSTDDVFLEVYRPGLGWIRLAGQLFPRVVLNGTFFGVDLIQINQTDFDIQFQSGGGSPYGAATYGSVGTDLFSSYYTAGWLWRVRKVSNGNMAEVPPVVRAVYTGADAAAQNTSINFSTKSEDTHSAVTTGTGVWKFAAPIPGVYLVDVQIYHNLSHVFDLRKNGVTQNIYITANPTAGGNWCCGMATIRLNSGEYIDVRDAVGANIMNSSSFIQITRLGN